MKTEGIQTFIQMDKVLEGLIAEVKETVAAIIHLPAEKKSFSDHSVGNTHTSASNISEKGNPSFFKTIKIV